MSLLSRREFQKFCKKNGFRLSSRLFDGYLEKSLLIPFDTEGGNPLFSSAQIITIAYLNEYKRPLAPTPYSPEQKLLARVHDLSLVLAQIEAIYENHKKDADDYRYGLLADLKNKDIDRKQLKKEEKNLSKSLQTDLKLFAQEQDSEKFPRDLHELKQHLLNASLFRRQGRTIPIAKEYLRYLHEEILRKEYVLDMVYLVNSTLTAFGEPYEPITHHFRGRRCICCGIPIEIKSYKTVACSKKKCKNFADSQLKTIESEQEIRRHLYQNQKLKQK